MTNIDPLEKLMKKFKLLTLVFILLLPLTTTTTMTDTAVSAAVTKTTKTYSINKPAKDIKKVAYHSKNSNGGIYQGTFKTDNSIVTFTKKTSLDKYQTTWNASKKMTVKTRTGKIRTYYYVTSSDMTVAGWVRSKDLAKGTFKAAD